MTDETGGMYTTEGAAFAKNPQTESYSCCIHSIYRYQWVNHHLNTLLWKWLADLLQLLHVPVLEQYLVHCVKESFEFSCRIKETKITPAWAGMCSYNMVSLFTTLPLTEVIKTCTDALHRDPDIIIIPSLEERELKLPIFVSDHIRCGVFVV